VCVRPTEEYNQLKKGVQPLVGQIHKLFCASDLKKLWIWLTEECNQLKKAVQPTYSRSDTLIFFNKVCIRPTVHRTNSSLKLYFKPRAVGPKYRRTDVTLDRVSNKYEKKGQETKNKIMIELSNESEKKKKYFKQER